MNHDGFTALNPVIQAFLATLFTWGMTALGAATVFVFKGVNRRILDIMLGFAAGVMIAASFWSLLAPAIEMSSGRSYPAWIPAVTGFLMGGVFLRIFDKIIPHLHIEFPINESEGIKTSWKRSTLLVTAITLHNIPEGLAVGVAFGALSASFPDASLGAAIALAMGIGIQNFPEGLAVSLPLRRDGMSRWKSFWYGQLSAVVEPIAAVAGAASVIVMHSLLPFALAFAAGAMIFVVIEEIVPEAQRGGNGDAATMGGLTGFALMMLLDVAFS